MGPVKNVISVTGIINKIVYWLMIILWIYRWYWWWGRDLGLANRSSEHGTNRSHWTSQQKNVSKDSTNIRVHSCIFLWVYIFVDNVTVKNLTERQTFVSKYLCVCVCLCVFKLPRHTHRHARARAHTHTHTHTHTQILNSWC
jgi:hypothetical protein